MINPLHQNNLSFAVGVADFFVERGISQGTSITVPARVVSLVQVFGSRTLLLSSDRLLEVKGNVGSNSDFLKIRHTSQYLCI